MVQAHIDAYLDNSITIYDLGMHMDNTHSVKQVGGRQLDDLVAASRQ